MNDWNELEKINIENKDKYKQLFKQIIKQVQDNTYDFKDKEDDDYHIINENRLNTQFVHIVPKELINLFNKMREEHLDEFLGLTVLINKIRISCFGIPCSELSNVLIN